MKLNNTLHKGGNNELDPSAWQAVGSEELCPSSHGRCFFLFLGVERIRAACTEHRGTTQHLSSDMCTKAITVHEHVKALLRASPSSGEPLVSLGRLRIYGLAIDAGRLSKTAELDVYLSSHLIDPFGKIR
mmetsp:Transcript_27577/g.52486  ORF Transcript_27577/g.52486 Transcript_27577/m.52486 type:complete len:130 (-) Transcript_27577:269-658(-)